MNITGRRGVYVLAITPEEIEKRFTYHKPKDTQSEKYEELRASAREFARQIVLETPESREQSLAITSLEEAVMWANAAVARNE